LKSIIKEINKINESYKKMNKNQYNKLLTQNKELQKDLRLKNKMIEIMLGRECIFCRQVD